MERLIHRPESFSRDTLNARMNQVGVKHLARMELFLWDLEIFLQLQQVLGERLSLKGGAAVQFYLPISHQRTSVDIDMLVHGDLGDIQKAILAVESILPHENGLFLFEPHIPKQPKTRLPLFTYYLRVPSVCSELNYREVQNGQQRIKVEFILSDGKPPIALVRGDRIFAVESDKDYQVLPVSILFADKLTTLGPETIGIQDTRMDEQIKQVYDLYSLLIYNHDNISYDELKPYYLKRAQGEALDREIPFDLDCIAVDVMQQLGRLRMLDNGSVESNIYWRYILDFISLYVGKSALQTKSDWVVAGETLRLLFQCLFSGKPDRTIVRRALDMSAALRFDFLSGQEKGRAIFTFRDRLVEQYGQLTGINSNVLKGKKIDRIFWAIVTPDNIDELELFIASNIKM